MVRIMASGLGTDSVLIGAAEVALSELITDPAGVVARMSQTV
jgi:hypothetical protein